MAIFRITFLLGLAALISQVALSQNTIQSLKKQNRLENLNTKETIHFLYDSILNTKQFEKLSQVISADYTNQVGEKGVAGFQKSIISLSTAFQNAHWTIEEIICEEQMVVVKQKFTGTQTSQFQNISPTNKSVLVDGIATYELKNGKIIHSQIQTDRLGFMQQLGIIPYTITPISEIAVYFVDNFFVPKTSIDEFTKQMKYNQDFIANLSGYIKREAVQKADSLGNLTIITIVVWESQDKLDEAKQSVQTEFKRIGFNPAEFYKRLNIKMEREIYSGLKE
jgi:predicted ester cyclase/heme-degrading monooxygenase HmoA